MKRKSTDSIFYRPIFIKDNMNIPHIARIKLGIQSILFSIKRGKRRKKKNINKASHPMANALEIYVPRSEKTHFQCAIYGWI